MFVIAVVLAATFYSTAVNASIVAYGVKSISAAVMKLESFVSWLTFVGTVGSSALSAYWVISIVPELDVRTWLLSPSFNDMPYF